MRSKKEIKTLRVSKATHKKIMDDRDKFKKSIGGGEWSVDDTIQEYHKVLRVFEE